MNAPGEQKATPPEQAKRALYLSHFTPSMMPPETLEAMLVQREPLLTRVLGHVTESLRTGSRHHTLLVGPRGIGKTHLISLLHHRLSQTPETKDKALIAWMREEEWGVTSFFELVMRILRTLDASYPQFDITKRTEPLYELKVDDAAKQAEALLLDVLADKCLVVLMENLDDLFDQIGDQGQKAWRAFIQNHGNMVLVCTTPSLFAGVSIQKSVFYGFFDIEPLVELEFEDVVSLLRKTAAERGDADLVAFIDTPEGRARIRAVHHLAEGNPRIYIIFAQFLSYEALDELVQAFMHTLDELTPYYQARMKELPGQQRKITEYLVNYRGAAAVKTIAKACFISQQVCSSQLKQLKDKRYVRSVEKGRESYYELREPMMRMCMDVKRQRGEPISLFVEILRIWYTQEELQAMLVGPDSAQKLGTRYVAKALELMKRQGLDPKLLAQIQELERIARVGDHDEASALIVELLSTVSTNGTSSGIRAVIILASAEHLQLREMALEKVTSLAGDLESTLPLWGKTLNRNNAVSFYTTLLQACIGLFELNEQKSILALQKIVEMLTKFPAHAHLAVMNCLLSKRGRNIEGWYAALNDALSQSPVQMRRKSHYLRVGLRMYAAWLKALREKDQSLLLEIPSEERKLLLAFTEKLKPKK